MIGALISALATWTYEHEQDTFWKTDWTGSDRNTQHIVIQQLIWQKSAKTLWIRQLEWSFQLPYNLLKRKMRFRCLFPFNTLRTSAILSLWRLSSIGWCVFIVLPSAKVGIIFGSAKYLPDFFHFFAAFSAEWVTFTSYFIAIQTIYLCPHASSACFFGV